VERAYVHIEPCVVEPPPFDPEAAGGLSSQNGV